MSLTVLDGIIVVIVGLFAFRGFTRGFVTEVFNLLAVIIGIVFTSNAEVHAWAQAKVASLVSNPGVVNLIAWLLVFVVVWAVINMVGKAVRKVFKSLDSGVLEHGLGLAVGFVKGVLLASLLLACMQFLHVGEGMRNESYLTRYVNEAWVQVDSITSGFQSLPDLTGGTGQHN